MQNLISTAIGLTGWMQEPQSHNHMSDELYRAVLSGDFGAVQRLPEYNKCTAAPNNNNILHLLARAGDSSANAVKHILGENPNLAFMKNGDGETPLVIASRKGYSEVARQLIVASVGNDMKLVAVLEAVRFNRSDVVEMFLEQIPELFEKESHRSQNLKLGQLVNVIAEGLVSALLIEKKKKKKIYVESPLYLAVEKEHHDIVNMILSSSCKSIAFHGPEEDLTALHAAAIRNSPECIKMIFDKVLVDLPDLVGVDGWTPLHYAAKLDHIEIVKLLLSLDKFMGYLVANNDECKTALHIAVINGHLDVMQEIIEQCPQSWEMVTIKEKNILHLAIEDEQKQVLEWILGCSWSSELINQKDVDGNTPLHLYVSTKSLESYSLLSHAYGDMNPLNKHGLTPLDLLLDTANFTATPHQISIKGELERAGARPGLWRINHESETSHVDESDDGDENANTYMVVATLILTVAFAAGITVPGGYDTRQKEMKAWLF